MQTKTRQSQFELLRIVSMFMILIIHVTFFSTGEISIEEAIYSPIQSLLRYFTHSLCAGSVNTFVLISGYFGIRYKNNGLINLLFQCLFFSIGIYLVAVILGYSEVSGINIISSLLLFKNAALYWFIWAYIILYILSPVLNKFSETANKNEFRRTLILFYIITLILDNTPGYNFYQKGFSPLSFIGLYLLMQYIKRFKISLKTSTSIIIFLACTLANTFATYLIKRLSIDTLTINNIFTGYTNPLTIIQSIMPIFIFSKLKIQSKFINWVATSCFAVYLFHMHFCIVGFYQRTAKGIFDNYSGMAYVMHISLMIVVFFIIPILLDKVRIFCFNALWKK